MGAKVENDEDNRLFLKQRQGKKKNKCTILGLFMSDNDLLT